MISAEEIIRVFGSAPLPTPIELKKYGCGYADGMGEIADQLVNHTPGTFFENCAYIGLWPSPSTSLISTPSALHILADRGKWEHYLESLSFILQNMEKLDRTFYLAHFMFTRKQAEFTWQCLDWFANDSQFRAEFDNEKLLTQVQQAAKTWRHYCDRPYFWDLD